MAEPKKKQTKTRTDKRRSTKNVSIPQGIRCPQCQSLTKRHQVCVQCGFYKGVKVK